MPATISAGACLAARIVVAQARIAALSLGIFLVHLAALQAGNSTNNPVQDLRRTLQLPVREASINSPDLLLRGQELQQRIVALVRLPDLRDGLLLSEWRDDDTEQAIAGVDRSARLALAERFRRVLHDVLGRGDSTSQLAAVQAVSDLTVGVRGKPVPGIVPAEFAPDLMALIQGHDWMVRAAAAKTLGQIHADPEQVLKILAPLFEDQNTRWRRVAAEGIVNEARTVGQTLKSTSGPLSAALRRESAALSRAVVPVVSGGLADPDPEVRRLSVEAFQWTAYSLSRVVSNSPSDAAGLDIERDESRREGDADRSGPPALLVELKEEAAFLASCLNDSDREVRIHASQALEDLSAAVARLESGPGTDRLLPSVNDAGDPNGPYQLALQRVPPLLQPLREPLRGTVPALAQGLSDQDVRGRLAALDALEILGDQANAAVPALVQSLQDPNLFVRWAAARTLGKVGLKEPDRAVPGLAKLLCDPDLDLRLATTEALRRFGPAAAPAVPALGVAVSKGDAEIRLAAMSTLDEIGPGARSAVPSLIEALRAREARVRATAAKVLGHLGPAALSARDALTEALRDPDVDVRRAASDALLEIVAPAGSGPMAAGRPRNRALAGSSVVTTMPPPARTRVGSVAVQPAAWHSGAFTPVPSRVPTLPADQMTPPVLATTVRAQAEPVGLIEQLPRPWVYRTSPVMLLPPTAWPASEARR